MAVTYRSLLTLFTSRLAAWVRLWMINSVKILCWEIGAKSGYDESTLLTTVMRPTHYSAEFFGSRYHWSLCYCRVLARLYECIGRAYRDDGLDYRFVDAHLCSFQCSDIDSDPRDQHKLDSLAHLVSSVDAYKSVQPFVIFTTPKCT